MFRQMTAYKDGEITVRDCGNFIDQFTLQNMAIKLMEYNDKVVIEDMQGNEKLVLVKDKPTIQ